MDEQLLKRLDSIIDRVERDEPIDLEKEAKLIALDAVRAHVQHTNDAIKRTNEADAGIVNVDQV